VHWIETLEKYYEDIAPDLQPEVRAFLDEYYENKDTHSATSLKNLTNDKLEKLLYLEIKNENTVFIEKLSYCKSLKLLSIKAPIRDLKFLDELKNLRILDLVSREISYAKANFTNLVDLFVLSLVGNNDEGDLTNQVSRLHKVVILNLRNEPIESIIPFISKFPPNLPNLVFVSLKLQEIYDLDNIEYSPRIVFLDLAGNKIKVIPTSIKKLKTLVHLNIASNNIKILPNEIFEIPSLQIIHFYNNQLDSLPNSIFLTSNLKEVFFSGNPYSDAPNIKMISDLMPNLTDFENEADFFYLVKSFNKSNQQLDYNYVTLKTELSSYFEEYVSLTQQNSEDWVFNFEQPATALQADILRLKMENEIGRLKNAFQIAKLESQHLSDQLADRNAENQFLKQLSQSLSNKIDVLISGKTAETLNIDQLLLDIQSVAVRMLERKPSQQLEDLHNDILTDFLRQKGYVADHSRSGRSKLRVGEIDIMIRQKDGTPFSIIEAFRLKSCGKDNKIVAEHLDKLLHNYDTAGHKRNFVIIYAEAVKFDQLWKNYKTYVSELNGKPSFRAKYPLITFEEKLDISEKSSIKIGLAMHRREGSIVEIYHIFINMFS